MAREPRKEFALGDGVRNRLREIAHEIYDRLVMEEHVEENNRAENFLTVLLYSTLGLIVGVAVFFGATIGQPLFADAKIAIDPFVASVAGGFSSVFLSLLIFGRRISDFGLRYVGRATIYAWRRFPGARFRKRRDEMLGTVGEWLKSVPGKPAREVEQRFGAGVDRVLPSALTAKLRLIKGRQKGALDYIVFKGLFERKYKVVYGANRFRSRRPNQQTDDRADYYAEARVLRNAIKINLMLRYIGADLRDETPDGDNWKREYYTHPEGQQVTLWDEHDLPTRFRSFGPHLRWPRDSDVEQPNSVGEAPVFVAVEGVENPLQIPLYLLTVDDVFDAMARVAPQVFGAQMKSLSGEQARDNAIATLLRTPVPMFAKKDRKTLRALGGVDAPEIPVLRDNAGVLELRWDPNRILWERLDPAANADVLQALALLIAAIDYCAANEAPEGPKARRIILSRGDVLIVDNQRTLVCRRESDFYADKRRLKLGAGLPPQWWLRGFYGFRTVSKPNGGPRKRAPSDERN